MSNIVDVVLADKNLATMSQTVKAAGLDVELSKMGPFTVFAPSEIAFGKLANGILTDWMKPESMIKLSAILHHHVVKGKTSFKDLKDGKKLVSVNGWELQVRVANGEVTINGAKVQSRDTEASNGVVHSLDTVLLVN
ncbi:MAG TPA: fasciclin domain-containing protein [Chitinophagaceae bacterium]|nr:fasciclin domain-containing protein [Chitinophagaceae bacterium]